MKSNEWLRKQIKKYLEHPKAISQSELERRVGWGKGTLTKFLSGHDYKIDHEKYRKIVDIVAPWEYDFIVTIGKIQMSLLRKRYSKSEIAQIYIKAGQEMNEMAKI